MTLSEMLTNGFNPADYYYAGRILAGQTPLPDKVYGQLSRAINYIKQTEEQAMTAKKKTPAVSHDTSIKESGISVGKLKLNEDQVFAVDSVNTQISQGLQDFGIETDLTAEELFDVATQAFSTSLHHAVKAGVAYMAAQEALRISDYGGAESLNFKEWIKSRKLSEQRVYEVMRIAKGYLAIPSDQRKSYLSLSKYKALKLASIEPEALAELAEKDPEALGAMALMSRQEMASKIANLGAQLEIEQSKNSRLLQSQQKTRLTTFESRTEDVRAECMALQLEAELPMKSLQKLFEEVVFLNQATPESRLRIEQIWAAANIVASTALDMLAKLGDMAASSPDGNDLPQRALGTHILTKAEAEEWILSKATIENAYGARQAVRQAERDEAKPRGRGRPAKDKTKDSK